ncbi:MAG: UDP-N-acetylglucosamine--N-acetylmuramyl-(pentapeptide) pyrophosphoryl-undecaprenol N-acetylglucosamine transferase [Planctomycetes bacterium]|nr:UDP-N-acetylglucosamine--N-acetylmuramyl-(pentapeptide) pyrophosphoryl-undecaprenol N-acetylglucosamine transferase [Planctomycetota bacterium]
MPGITKGHFWLACGGTGGHFMPGVVVGRALQAGGCNCLHWGEGKAIEESLCLAQGVPLIRPASGGRRWLRLLWLWREMWRRNRENKPSACLLFGGFSSFALGLYALCRGIPVFIFEQNAIPGRTNRLLAPFARCVFLSFAEAAERFPGRVRSVHTGNPVRKPGAYGPPDLDLLILGGSQGARFLNETLPRLLPKGLRLIHVCGPGKMSATRAVYTEEGLLEGAELIEEHSDIPALIARSRWVISRAGATSMAEICSLRAALIAVPYPHAKDDHQRANARALACAGAALIVEEERPPSREEMIEILSGEQVRLDLCRRMAETELADIEAQRSLRELAHRLGL